MGMMDEKKRLRMVGVRAAKLCHIVTFTQFHITKVTSESPHYGYLCVSISVEKDNKYRVFLLRGTLRHTCWPLIGWWEKRRGRRRAPAPFFLSRGQKGFCFHDLPSFEKFSQSQTEQTWSLTFEAAFCRLKWPQNSPGRQSGGSKILLVVGGHMLTVYCRPCSSRLEPLLVWWPVWQFCSSCPLALCGPSKCLT